LLSFRRVNSNPNCFDPFFSHSQFQGSSIGEIQDTARNIRATVIYPHDEGTPCLGVNHEKVGSKGEVLMRRRHGIHIVFFAVSGGPAMETMPIP